MASRATITARGAAQEGERKQAGSNVKSSVVQDLLPLIDNFESASKQVKTATPGEEKINASYQGLYRQMVDIFRGFGVEAVLTEGHQFDPEVHEAIMREESETAADGEVLQEFRKGFQLNGKLLRPAMVKVAAAAPKAADANADALPPSGEAAAEPPKSADA